jgi:putative heme-binding domain-containing protein
MLRGTVVDVLLDYGPWRGFLLQALQKGRLHGRDLSLSQRERLRKREPSAAAWLTLPPSREEALRDHAGALKLEGAPQRGRPIFLERCVLCHRVGEEGTNIGPDLRALTNRSAEAVYAAILDPNRAVEPLYLAYTATTRSGEVIYGVLKGETGNTVTLAQLDGRERALRRSDLAAFEGSGRSLMPEGLESDLSDQGLADLIAFVRTLK